MNKPISTNPTCFIWSTVGEPNTINSSSPQFRAALNDMRRKTARNSMTQGLTEDEADTRSPRALTMTNIVDSHIHRMRDE